MSKEKIVRVLGVGAAVLLLGVSVVRARAQGEVQMKLDGDVQTETGQVMSESVAKMEAEVESSYYLPYPGVLPDQPLYWVKMLRDRVVEIMTIDLESKADLWSYYADKRVGAAIALTGGNKIELGVGTYQKAIKYQEKSVGALEELKASGKDVGALANKLEQATTKYRQMIEHQKADNEQFRGSADELLKMVQSNRDRLLKLLGRDK